MTLEVLDGETFKCGRMSRHGYSGYGCEESVGHKINTELPLRLDYRFTSSTHCLLFPCNAVPLDHALSVMLRTQRKMPEACELTTPSLATYRRQFCPDVQ